MARGQDDAIQKTMQTVYLAMLHDQRVEEDGKV